MCLQLCDRGNHVEFSADQCLITNVNSGSVLLRGKRHNNVYKVCVLSLLQNHLTCLSALDDDVMLWHKRLGCADLVVGLPSIKSNSPPLLCPCVSKFNIAQLVFEELILNTNDCSFVNIYTHRHPFIRLSYSTRAFTNHPFHKSIKIWSSLDITFYLIFSINS